MSWDIDAISYRGVAGEVTMVITTGVVYVL